MLQQSPATGSLRLIGGDGVTYGTLLIYVNGAWGSIGDSGWGWRDARVACRQLGHTTGDAVLGSKYGAGSGPVWTRDVACSWNESRLLDCPLAAWGNYNGGAHTADAGVVCRNETDGPQGALRLGGANKTVFAGTLEIWVNGSWGSIGDSDWDWRDARVACRQLGFTTGLPVWRAKYGPGSGPVWTTTVGCVWNESRLVDCARAGFLESYNFGNHAYDAGVECYNDPDGIEGALRLVGANKTASAGTLQVWYNGSWGSIGDSDWDWRDARVACRQLGFVTGLPAFRSKYGPASGPIWTTSLSCVWSEGWLMDCARAAYRDSYDFGNHAYDAGVECSNSPDGGMGEIRLGGVNKTLNAGTLEIWYNGSWGSIGDSDWDWRDARVACRQLGFTTGDPVYRAGYGLVSGPIWLTSLGCVWNESRLDGCVSSGFRDSWNFGNHGYDAGVVCRNETDGPAGSLRLAGSNKTASKGTVEIWYNGSWGSIGDSDWDWRDARVACRQLGFTTGLPVWRAKYGPGSGRIWLTSLGCAWNESRLDACVSSGFRDSWNFGNHGYDAGVECFNETDGPSGALRLAGSLKTASKGTVEIWYNGSWGSIGDSDWDWRDARVACRQLGFVTGLPAWRAKYGPGSGPIWLTSLGCVWNESRLDGCVSSGFRDSWNFGDHGYDAGVECYNDPDGASLELRLTAGLTPNAGIVEIWYNGTWGALIGGGEWGFLEAHITCRQLGYVSGRPFSDGVFGTSASGLGWLSGFQCFGNETSLLQCQHGPFQDRYNEYTAGVECTDATAVPGSLRLVRGPAPNVGQVEVFLNNAWGTLCRDGLNWREAVVICRQLGYSGGGRVEYPRIGDLAPPWTPMWTALTCRGNETRVLDCGMTNLRVDTCGGNQDSAVSVACFEGPALSPEGSLRLVGGSTNRSGRLELSHSGTWAVICSDGFRWQEARVACRQLGFKNGLPVYGSAYGPPLSDSLAQPMFLSSPNCTGAEASLLGCVRNLTAAFAQESCNANLGRAVGVTCTDEPDPPSGTLRLSDGPTNTAGRLEIFAGGTWGTVCLNGFDPEDAIAACRQLGFRGGRVLKAAAVGLLTATFTNQPTWLADANCTGTEARLDSCRNPPYREQSCWNDWHEYYDIGLVCSADPNPQPGAVRLLGGSGPHVGRVEVWHNGRWGGVCASDFTARDAEVVCRQLGFSGGRSMGSGYSSPTYGRGYGPTWLRNMSCNGTEAAVRNCPGAAWDQPYCFWVDVGVACLPETEGVVVELTVDAGSQAPELLGSWRVPSMCPPSSLVAGLSLQRMAFVASQDNQGVTSVTPACFQDGALSTLYLPTYDPGAGAEGAVASCAPLANGSVPYAVGARLQVLPTAPGRDDQGITDVQLRCSDGRLVNATNGGLVNATWGPWSTCPGGTAVCGLVVRASPDCPGLPAGQTCDRTGATGLRIRCCTLPSDFRSARARRVLRLMGGASYAGGAEGRLEVLVNGTWGTVDQDQWGAEDARVACRQLGWATGRPTYEATYGTGSDPIWYWGFNCTGTETSLTACPVKSGPLDHRKPPLYLSASKAAGVVCSSEPEPPWGTLRLVDGVWPGSGKVQVFHGWQWNSVADEGWGVPDATVVCRQLGYRRGVPTYGGAWGDETTVPAEMRVLLAKVNCTGSETGLLQCPALGPGAGDLQAAPYYYRHGADAGVICSNDSLADGAVRLRGSLQPGEGRLEVLFRSQWGTVGSDPTPLDAADAAVACRQLGYRSGQPSASAGFGQGRGPIWLADLTCNGTETGLAACLPGTNNNSAFEHYGNPAYLFHSGDSGVVCRAEAPPTTGSIRLTGGTTRGVGRLEVAWRLRWGAVHSEGWGWHESHVACRQLGFGGAAQARAGDYGYGLAPDTPAFLSGVNCTGAEASLAACANGRAYDNYRHYGSLVILTCVDAVPAQGAMRITYGPSPNMGRLELYWDGRWGSIEPNNFGAQAAAVLCRSLGFDPVVNATHGVVVGAGGFKAPGTLGTQWRLTGLNCTGRETALWDCGDPQVLDTGRWWQAAVGVRCKPPAAAPPSPFPRPPRPPAPPSPPAPPPPLPGLAIWNVAPDYLPLTGGPVTLAGAFGVDPGREGAVAFACRFNLTTPDTGASSVYTVQANRSSPDALRCAVRAAQALSQLLRVTVTRTPPRPGLGGAAEELPYAGVIRFFGACPGPPETGGCSGHGICRLGTCACFLGWEGAACNATVPPYDIVSVQGAVARGSLLVLWEGAVWSARPALNTPLQTTWILDSPLTALGLAINASTGAVSWGRAATSDVAGTPKAVTITAVSHTGRVATYSFQVSVRPSYYIADLSLPGGPYAAPGSPLAIRGRLGTANNTNATARGNFSLAGAPVRLLVAQLAALGGEVTSALELAAAAAANGTFAASWGVPQGAGGFFYIFALHPSAPWNASLPLLELPAWTGPGPAPGPGPPLAFQRRAALSVPYLAARVTAAGLDPRFVLPTVVMDPGTSLPLTPFVEVAGALQDLRALVVNQRIGVVSFTGLLPDLALNVSVGPPSPACPSAAARECEGVTNTTAGSAPGVAALGLVLSAEVEAGYAGRTEFEVLLALVSGLSGIYTKVFLRVMVTAARTQLSLDPPGRLTAVLPPGGATTLRVTVTNTGNLASGLLRLPNISSSSAASWLSAISPLPLPPLPPGASAALELQLRAPPGAELGTVYTASMELRGDGGRGSVGLSLELAVASEPTGTLQVMVVDEYFTYDPAKPRLPGARVVVRGPRYDIVASGLTDTDGLVVFANLTAGFTYGLDVFSANHTSASRTVALTGGFRSMQVFLPRSVVQVTFKVVPTVFREEVKIEVLVVYQTFVPMPVIRLIPPRLVVRELLAAGSQVMEVFNSGLVAVDGSYLDLPNNSPDFGFVFESATWLQRDNKTESTPADVVVQVSPASVRLLIGRLPAMSHLLMLFTIQDRTVLLLPPAGPARRRLAGDCGGTAGQLLYLDPCKGGLSGVGVTIDSGSTGGGCSITGSGGGGGGGVIYGSISTGPGTNLCDDCAVDMLGTGLCLAKDLLAPWSKPFSEAFDIAGKIKDAYDHLDKYSKWGSAPGGRRRLALANRDPGSNLRLDLPEADEHYWPEAVDAQAWLPEDGEGQVVRAEAESSIAAPALDAQISDPDLGADLDLYYKLEAAEALMPPEHTAFISRADPAAEELPVSSVGAGVKARHSLPLALPLPLPLRQGPREEAAQQLPLPMSSGAAALTTQAQEPDASPNYEIAAGALPLVYLDLDSDLDLDLDLDLERNLEGVPAAVEETDASLALVAGLEGGGGRRLLQASGGSGGNLGLEVATDLTVYGLKELVGLIPVAGCLLANIFDCKSVRSAIQDAISSAAGAAAANVGSALGALGLGGHRRMMLVGAYAAYGLPYDPFVQMNPAATGGAGRVVTWPHVSSRAPAAGGMSVMQDLDERGVVFTSAPPYAYGAGTSSPWDDPDPYSFRRHLQQSLGFSPPADNDTNLILLTAPGRAAVRWSTAFLAMHIAAAEMWGAEHYMEWMNSNASEPLNAAWVAAWRNATLDASPAGVAVDGRWEAPGLLDDRFLPISSRAARESLLLRWNKTWIADPDTGLTLGGIDLELVRTQTVLFLNESINAMMQGYRGVFDALLEALDTVVAQESASKGVCARVLVKLSQRLVLTRQAFEATLDLDNGGSDPLTNATVTLRAWLREGGGSATASFAIGQPVVEGFSQAPSTGLSLPPGAKGTLRWLLVPREAAALAADTWYYIGGDISYVPGPGLPPTLVPLEPADIRVSPEGRLEIRYYIERFVQGDNPFTPAIEPSVPATLATLITNIGTGPARGVAMDSLQPQILENKKGLLVDFAIVQVDVNGRRQPNALHADVGDIPSNTSVLLEWGITASLQGTFQSVNASFTSLNPLNDPTLSSVVRVDVWDLVHMAWMEGPGSEDGLPDMLVDARVDPRSLPDQLHSSRGGAVWEVAAVPEAAVIGVASGARVQGPDGRFWLNVTVRVNGSLLTPPSGWGVLGQGGPGNATANATAGPTSGWQYLRADCPPALRPSSGWSIDAAWVSAGSGSGGGVRRLKVPYNAWLFYRAYEDAALAQDYPQATASSATTPPEPSTAQPQTPQPQPPTSAQAPEPSSSQPGTPQPQAPAPAQAPEPSSSQPGAPQSQAPAPAQAPEPSSSQPCTSQSQTSTPSQTAQPSSSQPETS
ncbi:hypothetical protein HYH03_008867 [Edaphochlamys debaryana]|uniref:SRCR domain-containing protein n=1 Tax=Edaphochlamys debaryana TaxID=47281 RepID=A0A835Y094_9CHLO|nr:hypothetical protein HYH03_008867 [Edaphochlamys debaryana]|eukprot:KAG2492959.1 hypothetical protein HYH03_008867 [Edaphochlamys debaryana]